MPDEILSPKKTDSMIDVGVKLTHLDLTRERTITEIVESYKKHRPFLDSSD